MLVTLFWFPSTRRYRAASRTDSRFQLTEKQWQRIADLFPDVPMSRVGGRPRVPSRICFEGILWVLRTGARWKDLPKDYPSYATCWRRFHEWAEAGIFHQAWSRLLIDLDRRGWLDWKECLADGTFTPAKKGARPSARPSLAKGARSWS